MEQAFLRNGNVHSADNWQNVLEPLPQKQKSLKVQGDFDKIIDVRRAE
jgi:hypothetical protein